MPDDRGALDNEIARLHGENAMLKKSLLDRGLPLPGGVNTEAASAGSASTGATSSKGDNRDPPLPSYADIERVKALPKSLATARRLIMNLQKDVLKKT